MNARPNENDPKQPPADGVPRPPVDNAAPPSADNGAWPPVDNAVPPASNNAVPPPLNDAVPPPLNNAVPPPVNNAAERLVSDAAERLVNDAAERLASKAPEPPPLTAEPPVDGAAEPPVDDDAQSSDDAAPRGSKTPLLIAGLTALGLLMGVGIGMLLANLLLPEKPIVKPEPDPKKEERPKEGFKMGEFQADDPIKTIKVTIDVGKSGEPLQKPLDLHLGFGFPLRLYPVGSESREPSFAAFPHKSSLSPGKTTVDAGSSASFEFDVSADEGLDELKTTRTLLSGLTLGDIHSIGFASRGDSDWELAGYRIDVNGALYASNDSLRARGKEIQARNEVQVRSRKAEVDALAEEVGNQKDIVDSGLAGKKEEAALKQSQADLRLLKDRLNNTVGIVAGYFPWFQESDPKFQPATPAEPLVKSIVVTLVTATDKNSGSENPLYLTAGGQKHLLAAAPDFLVDDPKREQKFEFVSTALKYDPISTAQIKDFGIGMLGSDRPASQIPDRAKLQRVIVEADGQVAYSSDKQEVDRTTLSSIRLVPPVHRDDLQTPVENPESAREWYTWEPGKAVKELADAGGDEPFLEESDREKKNNPFVDKKGYDDLVIDEKGNLVPIRRQDVPPWIPIYYIPPSPGGTSPWSNPNWPNPNWSNPNWSNPPWTGPPWTWPINIIPPTPTQPPVIRNVVIATSGLLQDQQPVLVTWDVVGNTSKINKYRVTLNPVLPHQWPTISGILSTRDVAGSSARALLLRINMAGFTGGPTQRKYLYVEPQVTALDQYGNTINGAATKGPIVPVSPIGPPSTPRAFRIGPMQPAPLALAGQSCPGYQFCGNGFGANPIVNANDRWTPFTPIGGRAAWLRTSTNFVTSSPLKLAPFGSNMGTRSYSPNAALDEVQWLSFTIGANTPTGGTFTLTYGTNLTTAAIPYVPVNTLPTRIQAELNRPANFGAGNTTVTLVGGRYRIKFTGDLGNANLDLLTSTGALIPVGAGVSVGPGWDGRGNEVQKLSVAGGAAADNFKLRSDDATTNAQNLAPGIVAPGIISGPYGGVTKAQVENHLSAIPGLNAAAGGNVKVVGANGGPFTLVFHGTLAKTNVPTLLCKQTGAGTVTLDTVSNGGNYLLLRYDAHPVNISGNMHVVAHLGFIDSLSQTAPNSAKISARVIVANGLPATITPTPVLRIDSTKFTYHKQPGGPMQLIDIPIRLNANGAAFNSPFTTASTNCQLAGNGPKLGITHPVVTTTPIIPAAMTNAYVSVTFEIEQQTQNANEGVGVFGVRIVPE